MIGKQSKRARSTSVTLADTASSWFATQLSRAKEAFRRHALHEAEIFLRQAIALDPASAEAHNLMGVVHEIRHEPKNAYRAYRKALRADANYIPARTNLRRFHRWVFFRLNMSPADTGDLGLDSGRESSRPDLLRKRAQTVGAE
jgi:tetratricopeptide (TPR) repeat protein